ncbi:MAG: hypothetical protein KGN36_15370 [Acidobacteriota bacterium]|nr:hypothetical protein [Acidobacteriota bacterium]
MKRIIVTVLVCLPCLMAQNGVQCQTVGGAIATNFIDQTSTLGTATGDLAGGLGVNVLGVAAGPNGSTVFHNHHRWVTQAGETIALADADATAFPAPAGGLFAASYLNGVQITGGTGRFANASGTLTIFGAVDLDHGQIVLRYSGQVCFRPGRTASGIAQ